MKKSVLLISLLSGTALMFPRLTIASGFPTHTHISTPKPEPAFSFIDMSRSFKTAAVCFLGAGDCGDARFSSLEGDDDYKVDTVQQCKNEGYSVTSCSLPAYPSGQCPYNSAYFAKCVEDRPRACKEAGFTETSCPSGYITDRTCPYDSSYIKSLLRLQLLRMRRGCGRFNLLLRFNRKIFGLRELRPVSRLL